MRQAPAAEQGVTPTRWTLPRIRAAVEWLHDYSLSGVWRVLDRLDLGWRWARPAHFSPDPAYADKQAHLLDCWRAAARQPDAVVLVFLDEMGFFRWPQGGRMWMPVAPMPPLVLPCADNNRQWRLIGALNAVTGVCVQGSGRQRAQ